MKQSNKKKITTDQRNRISGLGEFPQPTLNLKLRVTDVIYVGTIALFSFLCMELFYRMTICYNGKYPSDVKYYVEVVQDGLNHDARMLGFVFQRLWGINHTSMEISIYMALVIAGIILMNFLVIRFLLKEDGVTAPVWVMQFFSLTALFMGPIYFPVIHEWFYKNSFQTFAWHSPTQQSMILFALVSILCFLKMYLDYENRVHPGWWVASAAAILLSAWAKPGFFISLGLAVVILFLIELVRGGREGALRRFGRLFLMGCALVPGAIYLMLLQRVEYPGEGEDDGTVVVFDPAHILDKDHLIVGFFCGLAFGLLVFAVNWRKLRDRKYLFFFMIFLMGICQWVMFAESGPRAGHGNFGWGRQCGDYMLMLSAAALAIENFFDRRSVLGGRKSARACYLIVLAALFTLHVGSQLVYFHGLLKGHKYFI